MGESPQYACFRNAKSAYMEHALETDQRFAKWLLTVLSSFIEEAGRALLTRCYSYGQSLIDTLLAYHATLARL